MIRVFSPNDKIFTSNGDVVINPLKAKVHKQDNGDYYLDLETSLDYVDYLAERKIVVANTPQGEQAFRITNTKKTRKKVTVKAWHVFYDSENYLIADSYVVDMNCNNALDHLNMATEPSSEFTTLSDISTIDSYRCVRKSLYEAIQTVLDRWGGHLVRDNFNIKIMSSIGVDNGVTVRYAKNLKELTCEENWDNVVTKLLPVGKDGILLNDLDASQSIYMTSDKQWEIPYTKTVSFEQSDIEQDNYQDETTYKKALIEDLKEQARGYLEENCMPKVNYTMKANLEKVTDIGDTVEVIDERLKVNLMTNVIAFEYDCILGKYTEIEFGNFKKSLSGFASSVVSSATQSAKDEVGKNIPIIENTVTQSITGSFSSSYVQYDGTKILILDSIPLETAKNVILINNQGIAFSSSGINGNFTSAWSIDGTLKVQGKNIYKALYYQADDTVAVSDIYCAGNTTSSNTKLYFSIPLAKSLEDINGITLTEMKLNVRHGNGGYTLSNDYVTGGYDVLSDSSITVTYDIKTGANMATFILTKTSAYNGINNTPETIQVHSVKFTCN